MAKNVQKTTKINSCLHEVRNARGSVIALFDCKSCGGESDLSSETCWRGVCEALADNVDVDCIILSGYTETEYAGEGVDALNSLRRLAMGARRLAVRDPPTGNRACLECPARPASLFGEIAKESPRGPRAGHIALLGASDRLASVSKTLACSSCLDNSAADLAFLWKEVERISMELAVSASGAAGDGA